MSKEDIEGSNLTDSGVIAPTTDIVQDHPATWDWRLVLGFVALSAAAFYWM